MSAVDRLIVKLGRVYVEPHVRAGDRGVLQKIKGYWQMRVHDVYDSGPMGTTTNASAVYLADDKLRTKDFGGSTRQRSPEQVRQDSVRIAAKYGIRAPRVTIVPKALSQTSVPEGGEFLGGTQSKQRIFRKDTHRLLVPPEGMQSQVVAHEMTHAILSEKDLPDGHGEDFIGIYRSVLRDEYGEASVDAWDERYDSVLPVLEDMKKSGEMTFLEGPTTWKART